jgi:hypothetical protein
MSKRKRQVEIERILTNVMQRLGCCDHPVLAVHIEGDYVFVIVSEATADHPARAIRYLAGDKIKRMLRGQDPISLKEGDTWSLLVPSKLEAPGSERLQ